MSTEDEFAYIDGQRTAYRELLQFALVALGYKDVDREQALLLLDQTRTALRDICGEFGDNYWPDSLHLADVIEKHLARHLREMKADASHLPRRS